MHRGAVDGSGAASQALARWAGGNGLASTFEAGRWRELHPETNDDDYSDWLIEAQLELMGNV